MAKRRNVSDRYIKSVRQELLSLKQRYERGEVTDEELYAAENFAYGLERDYEAQAPQMIDEQFPNADREQWLFDYLCELVGMTLQTHGEFALPQQQIDLANRQIWKVINEMTPTWDKGDIYYPHPKNPELRHVLVRDLRDKKRRARARNRNRSDMKSGKPFRGQCALMADPKK